MAVAVDFPSSLHSTEFDKMLPSTNKAELHRMSKQRLSAASDSSETTLNAHTAIQHVPSAPYVGFDRAGVQFCNADTALQSRSGPSFPFEAAPVSSSSCPAVGVLTQGAPPAASFPQPYPCLGPSPTLSYPMGTIVAPQSYFPLHSLPPGMVGNPHPAMQSMGLSAFAAPFVPQAFHQPSAASQLSHNAPYQDNALAAHLMAFPPPRSQLIASPLAIRPRASSDQSTPSTFAKDTTLAGPRSHSFSTADSPTSEIGRAIPSRFAGLDDDDDRPLAHRRFRNDSLASSASSSKSGSRLNASNASSRSITPTADASDAPRASMSTARGVAVASATLQQTSHSLTHQRSAPSLTRPSPLSQERFEDDLLDETPSNKRNGAGRLKQAFTIISSDSTSSLSSPRGHEKGSASVASNTSFSSVSTSPPRTPPDPAFVQPFIYSHPEAETSTTTLPDDATTAFQAPRKKKSLFSSRMNASTDNISVSSTVSSASMMIRKIGTFGSKLTKRGSLGSIGSMFSKDKDSDARSELSASGGLASRFKKKDRKKSDLATASLTHVHAEQESPPRGGMTPAKALVQQQQQLYAEQEAAEAAQVARQKAEQEARMQQNKDDKRLKAIEKEKEKLKGRRVKKWGLGSFGGGASISYASSREMPSHDDLTEFGTMMDDTDFSHVEHAATLASPRVPVPAFLEDRSGHEGKENASFSESTNRLFNDRWAASVENVLSYFEDDAVSRFDSPENTDTEGSVSHSKPKIIPSKSPLDPQKPVKGILKPPRLGSSSSTPASPFAYFERARSNSYNTPGTPTSMSSPEGFTIHPDHFAVSPDAMHGVNSPVTMPALNNGPYRHPALNVSAPVLHPQPHAPFLATRSVTAPPGKRLAFAPNLSVHTTWPAALYDRRSEPATCNKLTPAIAQRIKEELNAYKLNEMDVHHTSRIYTHFFA